MPETIGYVRNKKIRRQLSKELQERFDAAKARLHFGMSWRQETREGLWLDSETQYNNELGWDRRDDTTADLVNVNVSFSTIATLVPFISDESPVFKVEPYSGDASLEVAKLLQAYLNRLWDSDDMNGQQHFSDATFDYALYGDGYVYVGFEIEERPQLDGLGDPVGDRTIDVARVFVERQSPWDVWIDPYSDGTHNARWVARRVIVPTKEVLESDRYRVIEREDLIGAGLADLNSDDRRRVAMQNAPDERGFVEIFEFYDTRDKYMLAWSSISDALPIRYIENIEAPIVQMGNYKIPNSPYHKGELENIRSLQEELNKTRSQMITHRRRNVMKWIVREDRLSSEAISALQSSRINEIISVEGNEPFEQLIIPVDPKQLGQDAYLTSDIIRNDINELTGVNEYLRGVPQDIRRTATEASIVEGAANIRTRHKLKQIETSARHIGQLVLDITADVVPQTDFEELKLYITGREADDLNRILGEPPDSDLIFVPTPETFVGKYVVFVESGSSALRDPAANESKFKEMYALLLNGMPLFVQLGLQDAIPNMRRVMELWFEAAGISDLDSMFADDAQREDQLLQQQVQQQIANGEPGGAVRGTPTLPGQPREQAARPPDDQINSENSGILGPLTPALRQ